MKIGKIQPIYPGKGSSLSMIFEDRLRKRKSGNGHLTLFLLLASLCLVCVRCFDDFFTYIVSFTTQHFKRSVVIPPVQVRKVKLADLLTSC